MKKIIIAVLLALVVAVGFGAIRGQAFGTGDGHDTCVPKAAYSEVIEHPAVTHTETVIITPAVDAVAEVWANFSPTKPKTFVGPPSYPSDARGKWNVHNKIPGGHEGPDGVYSKGNAHKGGDWFYRQAGHPAVPAVTETKTITDHEAYTETINHPAVVCDNPSEGPTPTEPPVTDTPTPTVPPVTDVPTPTEPPVTDTPTPTTPPVTDTPTPAPPTEEPPVVNPPKDNPPKANPPKHNPPKSVGPPPNVQLTQCVDGEWVITENDKVLSRGGSCDENSVPTPTRAEEEGF